MHAYLNAGSYGVVHFCSKVPFTKRLLARRAMRSLSSTTAGLKASAGGVLTAYRCPACGYWHVGGSSNTTRSR